MPRVLIRRILTPEFRERYQLYIQREQPDDDQQLQYLQEMFPELQGNADQYFQIFQILNNQVYPREFQNQQSEKNRSQFQNNTGNQILNKGQNTRNKMAQPVFVDDPYHGDSNRGTTNGAKLYLKATAAIPEDDKFDLNISSSQKFLDLMRKDSNNFGWGALIRVIPEADANTTKNLLKDHKMLTEQHVKKQAFKIWGSHATTFETVVPDTFTLEELDPTNNENHRPAFFRRVRSRMITKKIMGHLKTADLEILKNQASKYTWSHDIKEEINGPTMLWLLMQANNSSTRVGVSELKTYLRNATSAKFQHDVKKLTNYMSSKNRKIEEKGQKHQDYQLDLFIALQTVPNPDFEAFVRDERQVWEIGGEKKPDQIIAESLTIYNNAVSANRWDNKDPNDAKILH